jgi:hypothetical protein
MTTTDAGERILADARSLAFPRYPGTPGDARAIEIVERAWRAVDLEVERESFSYDIRPAFRAIRVVLLSTAALMLGSALLAGWSVPAALAALLLGAAVGGVMIVWSPGAERLYARPGPTETENVVARRGPASPRMRVVLLAHHDSKSQNLSFPVRMGMTLAALLGGLGLAGTLVAALARPEAASWSWLPAGLAASALVVLSTLKSGNASPGGVDNAGSVAILFELARTLPARVPDDVELIFLSPGAEEDHMVGAMRWLDAHADDLREAPTYALNFDGAGAPGRTVLIERFGLGTPFAPTVTRLTRRCAAEIGERVRGITMLPAMGVDAIPFARRGIECLTLSSGSLDRATMAVHSAGDVADHLDPATLERVVRLAESVVCRLTSAETPRTGRDQVAERPVAGSALPSR